ncbi:MAG: DUF721 domain-containing protein [Bacteroidales bacterium]|nr:DUF721 domain-containing protein [Bacteroidales bacterium]MBQ2482868.1 DUF721 domain-containing protein [Bacteroidales bacterium]MBQ2492726.1 DUF721 domain-containing protein [Bacteroidales bacterium]MBQ4197044.1 DUF721 domain-containing protein [Bacteroidales bacterium]
MKKQSSRKLGDLLREYLDDIGRNQGILSARVVRCWDENMESNIVRATSSRFFKDGVLYVNFSSSIIRSIASRRSRSIIYILNKSLGGSYVKSLVLR